MRVDATFTPGTTAGKAFVFLPLPVNTGLPLHINGFFEVSENRRDIWYGDDMHGASQMIINLLTQNVLEDTAEHPISVLSGS